MHEILGTNLQLSYLGETFLRENCCAFWLSCLNDTFLPDLKQCLDKIFEPDVLAGCFRDVCVECDVLVRCFGTINESYILMRYLIDVFG